MGMTNGTMRKEEDPPQQGEQRVVQLQRPSTETTGMGAFDCLVCFEPLGPPILQCAVGHLICQVCRDKLKHNKCPLCSRTSFERCFGMEHVVESILVPCPNAKHGCTERMVYYQKEAHQKACAHAQCFFQDSGSGDPRAALLRHLAGGHHEWPSTAFTYNQPFDLRVNQPGLQVLHSKSDGELFLVKVASLAPLGYYAVALVFVRPDGAAASDELGTCRVAQRVAAVEYSKFGCSVRFSSFLGHHLTATLDRVRRSSLADGPPADYFCVVPVVPDAGDGIVLRFTIDTKLLHDDFSCPMDMEENDEDDC